MPDSFSVLRGKWRHWLGWYWGLCDFLLGLLCTWLCFLFSLAFLAAVRLLERTLDGADGSLGTGALIVALLSAPFLVWNTWIRHRALNFQKEGHLTDRLAKAVEQLGAEKTVKKIVTGADGAPVTQETSEPNLAVRIGGLLSLERIAQDSTAYDKGRDHVRVMEIICAYVRSNAPAREAKSFPLAAWSSLRDDATEKEKSDHDAYRKLRFESGRFAGQYIFSNLSDWIRTLPLPREDIALAVTILERRSPKQRRIEAAHNLCIGEQENWVFDEPFSSNDDSRDTEITEQVGSEALASRADTFRKKLRDYGGYRLDLRGVCLQRASLEGYRLGGVRIDGARLDGAKLDGAKLDGASMRGARLDDASLRGTSLNGAYCFGLQLSGANLSNARLNGTELALARMFSATMWSAEFRYSYLGSAHLQEASFHSAKLGGASLQNAKAQRVEFFGAHMPNCNLQGTALSGATMKRADLSKVKQLTLRQISAAFGDISTRLPSTLPARPTGWPEWDMPIGEFYSTYRRWQSDPATYTPPPNPALATPP